MNINKNEVEDSSSSATTGSYSSGVEKQQAFYKELKALLRKYDAKLSMESNYKIICHGHIRHEYEEIVVNFGYDKNSSEEESLNWIPQLNLGSGL